MTAAALEQGIRAVVQANPAWGVRKVWATLRRPPHGLQVGKRRVWAMMRALGLTLPADGPRDPERRRGHVAVQEPNRRWAGDLTTVATAEDGVVAVVPVIDCGCRSVLAVAVTNPRRRRSCSHPCAGLSSPHSAHAAACRTGSRCGPTTVPSTPAATAS